MLVAKIENYEIKSTDHVFIDGVFYKPEEIDFDGSEKVLEVVEDSYTDTDSFSPTFQATSHFTRLYLTEDKRTEIVLHR